MDSLRRPLFFTALALIVVVVLVELGHTAVLPKPGNASGIAGLPLSADVLDAYRHLDDDQRNQLSSLGNEDKPPGLAILYMAFLDGVLAFTAGLIGAALLIPERVQGRLQGC